MKKILSTMLSTALLFSFAGCFDETTTTNSSSEPNSSEVLESSLPEQDSNSTDYENSEVDSKIDESSEDSTPTEDNDKVLVAYFSASGNTKNVAEYIAGSTNADIFEIVPQDAYTAEDLDYTSDKSRVSLEYNDQNLRNVPLEKTTPDNWEEYSTVFIGYPIWWGIAAWPVNNFVIQNNFDGKTVIPFCTSGGSGLGESGNLLKEMSGTGNWLDGMRFSPSVSQGEIDTWLETIDY